MIVKPSARCTTTVGVFHGYSIQDYPTIKMESKTEGDLLRAAHNRSTTTSLSPLISVTVTFQRLMVEGRPNGRPTCSGAGWYLRKGGNRRINTWINNSLHPRFQYNCLHFFVHFGLRDYFYSDLYFILDFCKFQIASFTTFFLFVSFFLSSPKVVDLFLSLLLVLSSLFFLFVVLYFYRLFLF